jgi:hypothetical protein
LTLVSGSLTSEDRSFIFFGHVLIQLLSTTCFVNGGSVCPSLVDAPSIVHFVNDRLMSHHGSDAVVGFLTGL